MTMVKWDDVKEDYARKYAEIAELKNWNSVEVMPDEEKPLICRVKYSRAFMGIDYGSGIRCEGKKKIACERGGDYEITHWIYDNIV